MRGFLHKLFSKSYTDPPRHLKKGFLENFPDAVNAEWYRMEDCWEVLFHSGMNEKIARINDRGELYELRTNIPVTDLPEFLTEMMLNRGEVMNAIAIDGEDARTWELIYRDANLNRYMVLLDSHGTELDGRML